MINNDHLGSFLGYIADLDRSKEAFASQNSLQSMVKSEVN